MQLVEERRRAPPGCTFGPHSLISVYVPDGRVDDGRRGARLVGDPHEVVEDPLGRQLLDDARAGAAAGEAGRDHGHVEPLERAGDVDPLAAGEREHAARAVAVAELEVRDGDRPVERGVERDGEDHERTLLRGAWFAPAYQRTRPPSAGRSRPSAPRRAARCAEQPVARVEADRAERGAALDRQRGDLGRRDDLVSGAPDADDADAAASRATSGDRPDPVADLHPRVDACRSRTSDDGPVLREPVGEQRARGRRSAARATGCRGSSRRSSTPRPRAAATCDQPAADGVARLDADHAREGAEQVVPGVQHAAARQLGRPPAHDRADERASASTIRASRVTSRADE